MKNATQQAWRAVFNDNHIVNIMTQIIKYTL